MFVKLILFLLPSLAWAQESSLEQFLTSAWEKGPVRRGESLQSDAAREQVRATEGRYLPQVSLQAIDSTGFPSSNSDLNVSGLMGSPFRSGLAGGLIVEQTVYDFGRVQAAVAQTRSEMTMKQARLAAEKFQFLHAAGQLYLRCARARLQQQTDDELMGWAEINLKETAKYTRTGQRSIVDNSLVQAEVNSLQLELAQLRLLQASLLTQMALYGSEMSCKRLSESWSLHLADELKVEDPSVLLAKAQIDLAKSSLDISKAAQLPAIKVMGSLGGMEKSRLVDVQDYAAGVALTYPIWNGSEDYRREQAFHSQIDYQIENLKAAQLDFSIKIKNLYDEQDRERAALKVIERDLDQVRKTMQLASQRYRKLEGPLIDVREAFKQLRQMTQERIQTMQNLAGVGLQLGILNAHSLSKP